MPCPHPLAENLGVRDWPDHLQGWRPAARSAQCVLYCYARDIQKVGYDLHARALSGWKARPDFSPRRERRPPPQYFREIGRHVHGDPAISGDLFVLDPRDMTPDAFQARARALGAHDLSIRRL